MKITIRPDPDGIEMIRSEFKDMIIGFLKSLGIFKKDTENWAATHTIEINENNPPLIDVFDMKCYLPDELFAKPEWVFKFAKEGFFTSFIISGHTVCCNLRNTSGLKCLPKNLLNLNSSGYEVKTLNEDFQELKKISSLKSISFSNCTILKDVFLLENLFNLKTINLSYCESLTDISSLSGLLSLQSINLEGCKSFTDLSGLSGLLNLKTINLSYCESLTDISSLSRLLNLQSLNLRHCKNLLSVTTLSSLVNLKRLDLSDCKLIMDTSSLAGLVNLQTLNLSSCGSITDISSLAGLLNLQALYLAFCKSLKNLSGLSSLFNLQTLDLNGCNLLKDISNLAGLCKLQWLDLSNCKSITAISSLAGLSNLQSLRIYACESLVDIGNLSALLNLQNLDLNNCKLLNNISNLSGLFNLQKLDLSNCKSITDISSLAKLVNLRTANLSYCTSLTDVKSLSGLLNMQMLKLRNCESLTDIRSLAGLVNLQSLNLEGCKRIQNFSSLRSCLALKYLTESNMHPAESAELLCFLAVQRKDISFILEKAGSWLNELEMGFDQKHSSANDLACSLAQAIILAKLKETGLSFHQTLLNHPNVGLAPWKIWFSENLKTFGWDKIQKLAELNQSRELTFGAIAGISSCLPYLEGDPAQINWAKKWTSEIHSLHNNNANFLKPAAAEWCLALKRLGENELLREWIEAFTDPSDPFALDPINKVFSAYALDLNDSEFALEYALKINDPKLRDESILYLAQQFIKEGETSNAGEFLFLLTQIESRTQLAYILAEDAAYLKSDENAHRLLAACGDSPQSLASIFDKLRVANPASEILKIMNEKLSDGSRSEIPVATVVKECNSLAEFLIHTKDPSQLIRIQQALESILKSS